MAEAKAKTKARFRPLTKDEACDTLLKQLAGLARYWATFPDDGTIGTEPMTPLSRCNGLVFSILNVLDGTNMALPAFNLVPFVPDEDVLFHKEYGENWFDPSSPINDEMMLHKIWHSYESEE